MQRYRVLRAIAHDASFVEYVTVKAGLLLEHAELVAQQVNETDGQEAVIVSEDTGVVFWMPN